MSRKKVSSNVLLFLAIILALGASVFPQGASAQCGNGQIVDEKGVVITSDVCSAMRSLSSKAWIVAVYVSDEEFGSMGEWYAHLDEIEEDLELRHMQTIDGLPEVTLDQMGFVIAVAKVEGNYEATVEIGGTLKQIVPKINPDIPGSTGETNVLTLKALVTNGFNAGEPTAGIVNALTEAYALSYPPFIEEPTQQALPTSVPTPAPAPRDWTPLINLSWALVAVVILAALAFIYVTFGHPWLKDIFYMRTLIAVTGTIVHQALLVIKGDSVDETLIYSRMSANGVQSYPDVNKDVREWIRVSQQITQLAIRNRTVLLKGDAAGVKQLTLRDRIKKWELIYLLLVGTNRDILKLTDAELKELLDPMAGFEVEEADVDAGVRLLQEQSRALQGAALTVKLRYTDPTTAETQKGILEHIKNLKLQLAELREAKEEAAPAVLRVSTKRKEIASRPFPGDLTADTVLAAVDRLVESAETNLSKGLYLFAIRDADDAWAMLEQLDGALPHVFEAEVVLLQAQTGYKPGFAEAPTLVDAFKVPDSFFSEALHALTEADYESATERSNSTISAVKEVLVIIPLMMNALALHARHLTEIAPISKLGYRFEFVKTGEVEVAKDVAGIKTAIRAGNYAEATKLVDEIVKDSTAILSQVKAVVSLRTKNEEALLQLSREVARVQRLADGDAAKAWESLQKYAKANYLDISIFMREALLILQSLFNDPKNEDDVNSKIAKLNSMETQFFKKAETELALAESKLRDAESKLKAVVQRIADVREAEKTAASTLVVVRSEYKAATELKEAADAYIDTNVDDLLTEAWNLIQLAVSAIDKREYLSAVAHLSKARELLRRAVATSKEQAERVRRLLASLNEARNSCNTAVNKAQKAYSLLKPVMQKASTGGLAGRALDQMHKATKAEDRLTVLEDHELAAEIQRIIELYAEAEKAASEAQRRIEADRAEYLEYLSGATQMLGQAAEKISTAKLRVGHNDADYAGQSALDRAIRSMPRMPAEGATVEELERVKKAANTAYDEAESAQSAANSAINRVQQARAAEAARLEKIAKVKAAEQARRVSTASSTPAYQAARVSTPRSDSSSRVSTPRPATSSRPSTPKPASSSRK